MIRNAQSVSLLREHLFALDERYLGGLIADARNGLRADWMDGEDETPTRKPYDQEGPLAIVCIRGPLSQRAGWWCDGYDAIQSRVTAALADGSVTAVVLRISSPGGAVAGLFEACKAIRAAATEAGKPVVAYCDELAASAAYALACCADQIVLPASGEAGSVGVIAMPISISRMLDGLGVDVRVVKSGARKADLNPNVPIEQAAIDRLQATVDDLAGMFAALVSQSRGMSVDTVLALEAGVFMGQAAVAAGLADQVGGFDDAKTLALVRAQVAAGRSQISGDGRRSMSAKAGESARAMGPKGKRSMESIAKALGLKADASEGEILVALTEQRALLTGLVTLSGTQSAAEAAGVFRAWQEGSKRAEALAAQVAEAARAREAEEGRALLDGAIAEGRLPPASREEFAKLPVATLRSLVATLPKTGPVSGTSAQPSRNSASAASLTDAERAVCQMTGVSEEEFAKTKARRGGNGG